MNIVGKLTSGRGDEKPGTALELSGLWDHPGYKVLPCDNTSKLCTN